MSDLFSALALQQSPNQLYFKKLLDEGMNTAPISSHWQGASRLAHSLLAGLMIGQQNQEESDAQKLRLNLPGLGGDQPAQSAPPPQPASGGLVSALAGPVNSPGIESGPDMKLPRGIRNNNPLNMEAGPFTQGQPGFQGSDGRFARFEQPQQGIDAASKLLDVYQSKHGLNTVGGIVGRWAPSGENDTRGYAASVAGRLGISPDQPLTPEQRMPLIMAMGQFENGRPIPNGNGPQVVGMGGVPERPDAKGAYGADAVMLPQQAPQQTAQTDPAALPPNATPTQGGPVSLGQQQGQPLSGTAPYQRAPFQIEPGMAQQIKTMLASKDKATQQQGMQLYNDERKKMLDQTRSLTDPKERLSKGIQASDTNPYQVDAHGKVTAVNPQPFAVNVNQQGQSEFEKHYGEGQAKSALATLDRGNAAVDKLQKIELTQSILQKVQTGKLAPAQATIGAWAEAVGMKPETLKSLGIDPNMAMASQAAQGLMAQQTISMIGAGGFPANNFSDADRKFLQQIPGSISNVPAANEIAGEVGRRVAQRDIDKANAWAEARGNKVEYEKFERDWRKKVAGENMFADIQEKIKGMTGGQVSGDWQDMGNGVRIREKK